LELENEVLKRDLSETNSVCDDHVADVGQEAATIHSLQSDIMALLSRISECPQRQQDEHGSACDNAPFVVVLIDGSESMLTEEHVKDGVEGGKKAAREFHDHLMEYLTRRNIFENDWKLIIKIYASMDKLGTAYIRSGVINDIDAWRRFIKGFNEAHESCSFIDAGDDPARAQSNVQDQKALFFDHEDCQHTVLIGALGDSCTGLLRQYSNADKVYGRLIFVEAIPSAGDLQELVGSVLPTEKKVLFGIEIDNHITPPATQMTHVNTISKEISNSLLPGSVSLPIIPLPQHLFTPPASPVSCSTPEAPCHHIVPLLQSPYKSPVQELSQPQYSVSPRRSPVKHGAKRPVTPEATPRHQAHLVRRKPLASIQPRALQAKPDPPRRATFFNSQGQRIDPRAYATMYTQRYLQC